MKTESRLVIAIVLLITATARAQDWDGVKLTTSPIGPGTEVWIGTNRVIHAFRLSVGLDPWEFTEVDFEFETHEKGGSELALPWSLPNMRLTISGQSIPIELKVTQFDKAKATVRLKDQPYQPFTGKDFMVVADPMGGWASGDRITVTTVEVRGRPLGGQFRSIVPYPYGRLRSEVTVRGLAATITSIRVEPKNGGVVSVTLTGNGIPFYYMYMVQASRDFIHWYDLAGVNASRSGLIWIGVEVDPQNVVLGPLLSGNGVFFRIRGTYSPILCPNGDGPIDDGKTAFPFCQNP